MSLYNTHALAKAAGITPRQVDYWTHKGYLKPVPVNGVEESGSGHRRIYDGTALTKARIIAALTDLHTAHLIADALARGSQFQVDGRLLGWVERP